MDDIFVIKKILKILLSTEKDLYGEEELNVLFRFLLIRLDYIEYNYRLIQNKLSEKYSL